MSKSIAEAFELPSNYIVPATDPGPASRPLNSRGAPPLQIRHLRFTLAVYTGQEVEEDGVPLELQYCSTATSTTVL
uniref:Uncharacterized protein n=1 Tax=Knipowitschia caucasica TaxID=637954 RepID=A0AAV2JXF9_KNICA